MARTIECQYCHGKVELEPQPILKKENAMLNFNFQTLKTKTFLIGLAQVVGGVIMVKTGFYAQAGAVLIAQGLTAIGIRDALTKAQEGK
jgi:hypothetical protein